MPQIISPGVYTIENDLSQYVSNLSSTIVAMVGTADFGPSNTPTLITSAQQFVNIFGEQSPNHYLGYAAKAFLKQGNLCYITRVAPKDATLAKVTMVLPTSGKAYAGNWDLHSNTATTATFMVYDSPNVTGADKTIALDIDTVIPGFDFTDVTQANSVNGKLGSDLATFASNSSYVNGSSFSIQSGAGKNSSAVITNIANVNQDLLVTVDTSKFNTFNSPITATAVGEIGLVSSTPSTPSIPTDTPAALPTAGANLLTIGKTQADGNLTLVYNVMPTYSGAPSTLAAWVALLNGTASAAQLAAIDSLVAVSGNNVEISIPLSATSIHDSLTVMNAILNCLIKTLVTGTLTTLTSYSNLVAAFPLIRAQASTGVVGIGSVNATTGASSGLKASSLVMTASKATSIQLFAITTGASSTFYYDNLNNAVVTNIKDMVLSGTFTTNVYRPSWAMSSAGSNYVPTYLKFTSIGEGDFSDIALTLTFVPGDLDGNQNQNYTVRVFQRQSSTTIPIDSDNYSDFTLIESYYGTPESILTSIATSSQNIALKIDYISTDTANLDTTSVVAGLPSDELVIQPRLNADVTGKGIAMGLGFGTQGTAFVQKFDMFLWDGSSGSEITSYDILGDPDNKTGIYSFMDPEQIDINLIVAPGWSADPIVAKGLVDLCVSRADCMTILDTPFALDVEGVVNFRNNLLGINSNYGALYYPWVKVADSINQKNIFVPPSGMVAGQYAFNDYVGQVFTAPAGRNRGNLLDALTTERVLNQGDRDILALNQINPIHNESGYGTYIRGQQTLQKSLTALDRVNVRRLLIYLRKVIATASKYYEFEPADSITALRLKQLATSILDNYKSNGGIVSFTVDVGPNINTALTLDNNQLWMSISIVPTKTAEEIIEVFNILGQGKGIAIASA